MSMTSVVFFDIGGTLGSVRVSPEGLPIGLEVYPEARETLERLRQQQVRMGIISNPGSASAASVESVLERSGILRFFDPALLVFGPKNSAEIFGHAAELAGLGATPSQCVFVGEDSRERSYAAAAGFRVAPHPLLVFAVLTGSTLSFARIESPASLTAAESRESGSSFVPLHSSAGPPARVYGILAEPNDTSLTSGEAAVERLGSPGDPDNSDLYLVRDDRAALPGGAAAAEGSGRFFAEEADEVLIADRTAEGVYLIVPAGRSIEEFHLPGAKHGHNFKLVPDLALLTPLREGAVPWSATAGLAAAAAASLDPEDTAVLREIVTPDAIRGYLDRYSGHSPHDHQQDAGDVLRSRHIFNAHNELATRIILRDLQVAGGDAMQAVLHRFTHEGRPYYNVEGTLPGGSTDPMILITAHLDSTAASTGGYDPVLDPAPGADDDASGVAAVMVAAAALAELRRRGRIRRTIRFVLFNAEEHGLVGSKAYARDQASNQTAILAVFQMDMVGYRGGNEAPPRPFEVHVGYASSLNVERRSRELAELLSRAREQITSDLAVPQVYPISDGEADPAAGRSDHASFQERGYAACAVSEDFFVGPAPGSVSPQPNPNYHTSSDTIVDYEYAADIARVVTAAVLLADRM